MSDYLIGTICILIVMILFNVFSIKRKYKISKKNKQNLGQEKIEIQEYLKDFLMLLLTTFLSLFIALEFNEMERKKIEYNNYESYIGIMLNDLNNNKRSIVLLSKELHKKENRNDTIFSKGKLGKPIYKYPYAFKSMYSNDLFLKHTSQFTIHFLSQSMSSLNYYYDLIKDAEVIDSELFKNVRKYAITLDECQLLILDELYYQHGILDEEDLQYGNLIIEAPDSVKKHFPKMYNDFFDKIEKNRKTIDKINEILPPDAGTNYSNYEHSFTF